MRVVFMIVFILIVARWLKSELKSNAPLLKQWRWIAAAAAFQICSELIAAHMSNTLYGNIALHTIGGGVASTCLFFYLRYTFDVTVNWRLQLGMLFLFVSALGVLNELWEFSFELLHLGKYSFDSHDTWRDLTSNTAGALLAWMVIRAARRASRAASSLGQRVPRPSPKP
jgi:glycopeptide antibiotics resistance protein